MESPESSSECLLVNEQTTLLWSLDYEFPDWVGEWAVTQRSPLRKKLCWLLQAGSPGGMAGPWRGELISAIPCSWWVLQGSLNCPSTFAALFLKLWLHTGTPCYLSRMHSWKSHRDRKTQKRFTVGIQSHRGSSKIFWNNDFLRSQHLPKVQLPPSVLRTGYSDCTFLS